MEKEFVTYQIAKALKELGFDEPCLMYVHMRFGSPGHSDEPILAKTLKTTNGGLASIYHHNWITLPLWQQAIDFVHKAMELKFGHEIEMSLFSDGCGTWIFDLPSLNIVSFTSKEDAILKAIELIKK